MVRAALHHCQRLLCVCADTADNEFRKLRKAGAVTAVGCMLCACVSYAPQWEPTDYTVKSGDTLYSIAWRYELDPQALAQWNDISDTALIKPGQRLHTRPSSDNSAVLPVTQSASAANTGAPDAASTSAASSTHAAVAAMPDSVVVRRGDTLFSIARRYQLDSRELASRNGLKSPYKIRPGQRLNLRGSTTLASSTIPAKPAATTTPAATAKPAGIATNSSNGPIRWQWPAQGKLVAKYNAYRNDAKGIDISASEGAAVRAAAPGKVVYSGDGLISYGNLIIIKHDDTYLSAYAHNRTRLVTEGQQVNAGQTIAEMGVSGEGKPTLHFEIRKNGKPVDPQRYLPSS